MAASTKPILKVQDIVKSFGRRSVLNGVSLLMRRGELSAIVGENGAGKSTLLKILVGLTVADSGNVTTNGRVGYCPQDSLVFETLTVKENFHYFASAYGLERNKEDGGDWKKEKDVWLEYFKFKQYENALVSTLSGGTKQKLNLSLALLHAPDMLILDEPFAGFDWETYLHFWELTEGLRSAGKSILIVSHFIYDREKFDRIYELKDGVIECA
ncbi:MAG: type transport system ATP-binding protein [Acidobacteriota bacterium]|jgi:ABC-type multidrug transport system ATPase subunit|nr:type transport system ATP-binding protein [Acidobacteriota bacterium]